MKLTKRDIRRIIKEELEGARGIPEPASEVSSIRAVTEAAIVQPVSINRNNVFDFVIIYPDMQGLGDIIRAINEAAGIARNANAIKRNKLFLISKKINTPIDEIVAAGLAFGSGVRRGDIYLAGFGMGSVGVAENLGRLHYFNDIYLGNPQPRFFMRGTRRLAENDAVEGNIMDIPDVSISMVYNPNHWSKASDSIIAAQEELSEKIDSLSSGRAVELSEGYQGVYKMIIEQILIDA